MIIKFNKSLDDFVYKELTEKRNQNQTNISLSNIKDMNKTSFIDITFGQKDSNYSNDIIKYMDNNNYIKEKQIKKAKKFIFEDKNIENDVQKLIDKIMKNNFITKNSVDIISSLLNYIKEEIFGKYLKYIFLVLEDNNILTTLIEIQNNKNKEINEKIIRKLIEDSLDLITYYDVKRDYNPKFLYNIKYQDFIIHLKIYHFI